MKKPLLLNVISIVLMIVGIFCFGFALLALISVSPEQLAQSYNTDNPVVYQAHLGYSIILGVLLFVSGCLLFRGKESGRKVFVASVLIMAVYAVITQGIWGIQVLGIPILIIIFLYQYWGIKDYFTEAREYKKEVRAKDRKN